LTDVILDLVPVLEEAADSGRLVGGEDITIETVTTDRYINSEADIIVLKLSDQSRVELRVTLA